MDTIKKIEDILKDCSSMTYAVKPELCYFLGNSTLKEVMDKIKETLATSDTS